jgi:hypothetical protein
MSWVLRASNLVCVAAAWCIAGWAAAQSSNPNHPPGDFPTQEPVFQAKSNLVLVPVFVFTHDGLERGPNSEGWRCIRDDWTGFLALNVDQAYLPRACDTGEVRDLTLDDFRLFQDGEPQKIASVEKQSWWLSVRDNQTWHSETADTPSGMWSSADLGRSILPETSNFYLLAYAPARTSSEGGCHQIRVEVGRPGVRVFARDEYCTGQTPADLLNGTKIGKKLEGELAQRGKGKIPLFVQAGGFRSAAGRKLVDIVIEFPWNQLDHSWDQRMGRLHATIGVVGAVYAKDGRLITRFSDLLWPSYWPTVIKGTYYGGGYRYDINNFDFNIDWFFRKFDPAWLPTRYETQLDLAPGEYDLRVVLSDGLKVARAEVPLMIENDDGKSLALGSVFLCKRFRDAHVAAVETAAANFAPQYVPLVSKDVRFTPAGDTNFHPDERLFAYFGVYDPKLADKPTPQIQAHLKIVDAKSGHLVKEFPAIDAATYAQAGSTVIPIAREIPIATLPKGEYRLEVQATDSSGGNTPWRAASFAITVEK